MLSCLSKCLKRSSARDPSDGRDLKPIAQTDTEPNELELKEGIIHSKPFGDYSESFLSNTLKSHYLFRVIPESLIWSCIPLFRHLSVSPGTEIVTQGEPDNYFYLICTGYCEIIVNNKLVSKVCTGYTFGEQALLVNSNRKSTVRALSKNSLWALDRQGFRKIMKIVQEMNKNVFYSLINNCPFFAQMTSEDKEKIFLISFLVKFEIKEKICSQGDPASFLYFCKTGSAVVVKDGKIVGKVESGQIFGELSFINSGESRVASIICEEPSEVFFIDVHSLSEVLGKEHRKVLLKNVILNALIADKYAKHLPKSKIAEMIEIFKIIEIEPGVEVSINRKGADVVTVVCCGHIASSSKEFFSYSLIGFQNKNHLKVGTGRFRSVSRSIIAQAYDADISKIIGSSLKSYITKLHSLAFIHSVTMFNHLELSALEHIHSKIVKKSFSKGEEIFFEGQAHECIYIIEHGSVGTYNSDTFTFRFDRQAVFGESSLRFCLREYTAKALTSVSCLTLSKNDLSSIATPHLYSLIDKSIQRSLNFQKSDFCLIDQLHQIKDHEIYLASNISNNYLYRCEVFFKIKIYNQSQFQLLLNQKCVVAQLNHPHIPRFLRTLSDKNFVYFFYEHIESESLFQILSSQKLSEDESRFLFINLLSCLKYLHNKGILHRNLTSQAVLIDSEGFAKLTDFRFAKETSRSLTMLPTTVEYKAKEVILGKGYNSASEVWSCGVILYEMVFGELPFGILENDSYHQACDKVLNFEFEEVGKKISSSLKEVFCGIFKSDPFKRSGIKDIIESCWGKRVKINDIFYCKAKPEFKPKVKKGFDGKIEKKFKLKIRLNEEDKNNKMNFQWDDYF
jgi:CRP-like cAMP-binding protein